MQFDFMFGTKNYQYRYCTVKVHINILNIHSPCLNKFEFKEKLQIPKHLVNISIFTQQK